VDREGWTVMRSRR